MSSCNLQFAQLHDLSRVRLGFGSGLGLVFGAGSGAGSCLHQKFVKYAYAVSKLHSVFNKLSN